MKVPFLNLPLLIEPFRREIETVFRDILDRGAFISGEKVRTFEQAFAKAHNAEFFLGTSTGTDALHLALWGLGIGPGDRVIVPVNTFIATAEAVTLCGATPVMVDCDEYFLMDPKRVEEILKTAEANVAAIIPVHLYGQMADMAEIMKLAQRYGLKVIEDACQAHLAFTRMPDGKIQYAGTTGEAGAFSFYPGKNLGAIGEAGGVMAKSHDLHEKMLLLRAHGSRQRYVHELPGHNYRMEELQAAVLGIKLRYLEKWTAARREVADKYRELMADVSEVETPLERGGNRHVYHLFVIKVPAGKRDALMSYLAEKEIDTGLHYPFPLHLTGAYAHLGYGKGDFPVAETAAGQILSLPMCPTLTEGQIRYTCDTIKKFWTKR